MEKQVVAGMLIPKTLLKQCAIGCAALAVFCAVALTGFSNYFREHDAARAVKFNPLNVEARINLLANILNGPVKQSEAAELDRFAKSTIGFGSIDAQAYGQLGDIYLQSGDGVKAAQLFDIALDLSKTEPRALQRTLVASIEMGKYAKAVDKLDILFRRWPRQFEEFAGSIPILLRQPSGYRQVLSVLKTRPPWRRHFLAFLDREAATVDFAYNLQLDLSSDGTVVSQVEVANTIRSLLRLGKYYLAYRLFLLTQSEEDRRNSGNVFNGSFALKPTGRPFDWTLRNEPGASVSHEKISNSGGQDFSLAVQFLDKPVKRIGVSQYVYLPTGQYRLSVDTSGTMLRTPKGLHWSLDCIYQKNGVAKLDIPEGNHDHDILEAEFNIAENGCKILELRLDTDLIAESFRYRYSGGLTIHNVSITRIEQ
jgi:hypothetical protein